MGDFWKIFPVLGWSGGGWEWKEEEFSLSTIFKLLSYTRRMVDPHHTHATPTFTENLYINFR